MDFLDDFVKNLTCAVGGLIVYHDDIKLEASLLAEGTLHCIGDSLLSVENRDDDGCLVFELLLAEVGLAIEAGIYQGSHLVEMLGAGTLHLYLNLTVSRVHIVKLLFSALAVVQFVLGIEELIEMEDFSHSAQVEAQVVETSKLIFHTVLLGGIVAQSLRLDEPKASEVEVIT